MFFLDMVFEFLKLLNDFRKLNRVEICTVWMIADIFIVFLFVLCMQV